MNLSGRSGPGPQGRGTQEAGSSGKEPAKYASNLKGKARKARDNQIHPSNKKAFPFAGGPGSSPGRRGRKRKRVSICEFAFLPKSNSFHFGAKLTSSREGLSRGGPAEPAEDRVDGRGPGLEVRAATGRRPPAPPAKPGPFECTGKKTNY